jgi:hypothetical protein
MAVLLVTLAVGPLVRNDPRFQDELVAFPGTTGYRRRDFAEREEPEARHHLARAALFTL